MLASTVKFSRCGRQTGRHQGRLRSAERSVANATEPSGPNSVLGLPQPARRGSTPDKQEVLTTNRPKRPTGQCSTFRRLLDSNRMLEIECWTDLRSAKWLLRKEVIQPHLPVRLPCYDLVLIASPTFDGSLHKGWATGFGCYRLS